MGWGKSIVECCFEDDSEEKIQFNRISLKMFKYYWNQTIFFDLQQGSNPLKPPTFISYVKSKIEYTNLLEVFITLKATNQLITTLAITT